MAARSVVTISNPSSNQEMGRLATALAADRRLERYHVPLAIAPEQANAVEARLGRVGKRFARELRRRPPPPGVSAQMLRRTATVTDLARVAAARATLPAGSQRRIAEAHRVRFDRAVARGLEPGDGPVVAVQGSALATLRRAAELGREGILHATLPHPLTIASLLERERALRFDEAAALRGDMLDESMLSRRLEEIAAAGRILALSSFQRDTYAEHGVPAEQIEVIPLGVDSELFTPASEGDAEGLRVICVGRVSQAKGIGYLLEGFRAAALPGAELVLLGDLAGADPSSVNAPGVRHIAPVPRAALPEIFRSADVLAFPTLADSFGFVVLEAMACGLPVIVSENSIGRDAVEDGREGFVVPIRDAGAIAGALRRLAHDVEARHRMGRAARRRALEFSWDRYCAAALSAL